MATSSFEGRALPRQSEELTDQGLEFDVGTILERRRVLRGLGLGAAAFAVAACTDGPSASPATSASDGEIPDETAGPYPGDGSNGPDVLEQSGVVRGDLRSSFGGASATAGGVPMTLELTVTNLGEGGVAFAGVAVYVWHCDREGRYSLYSEGVTGENYLRGVQIADAAGKVSFTSIFPACYTGRWPHVHVEVYPGRAAINDAGKAIATSQVALPKAVCDTVYALPGYEASVGNLARVTLDSDNVFGDDGGVRQLGTVTGDATRGYTVSLAVAVDPRTTPMAGGAPPGGAPPGGGPPPGPPPSVG